MLKVVVPTNVPIRYGAVPIVRCFSASITGGKGETREGGEGVTGAKKLRRNNNNNNNNKRFQKLSFRRLVKGPALILESGKMANQTFASLLGRYQGSDTTILTTIAAERSSTSSGQQQQQQPSSSSSSAFLTTEYRERHHAVGRFPKSGHRRDNRMLSLGEVLASRALDRALRPLLKEKLSAYNDRSDDDTIQRWHVASSLQAMNRDTTAGDAIPLAINTAAAALQLPVAAVSLGITTDGQVVQDSAMIQTKRGTGGKESEPERWLGHLLYAGTQDGKCVMMEWGAWEQQLDDDDDDDKVQIGLPDDMWPALLEIAQDAVQDRLETIQSYVSEQKQEQLIDVSSLRASLGLTESSTSSDVPIEKEDRGSMWKREREGKDRLIKDCVDFCEERLKEPMLRLFGLEGKESPMRSKPLHSSSVEEAFPMLGDLSSLIKKNLRSKLEGIVQKEVEALTKEFLDRKGKLSESEEVNDPDKKCEEMANEVYHRLMRKYLYRTTVEYGCRSDGRKPAAGFGVNEAGGWNTVRPIQVTVPALPDAVHGSAHFARGETGVLATVTLASPKEGLGDQDPFDTIRRESREPPSKSSGESGDFHDLPVGSLRFLRTQEALVSDLNSRNSQADKERTGSSGSLAEKRRAFVQYDFPGYSTGQVPSGNSNAHNRRALGHGALAEKALIPVLPSSERFPYAIRITAETVDSNGSSSMATICGSYLALLDAGVPVLQPVAGVSVGLAMQEDELPSEDALLLDITGTEDYFGKMDFKIGGTRDAVTALQLDVKEPVETKILSAALKLAKAGRNVILDEMEKRLERGFLHRSEPKISAPAVEVVKFDASRKRDLIGPGGVVLRQLEDRYSVSIDLTQEGRCLLYGEDRDMVKKARSTVMDLVADVQEGEIYEGTIVELKDFGAVVELLRNKEALLHVSELTDGNEVKDHPEGIAGFVRDNLKVGQTIDVQCIGVDPIQGSIKVSRKAVLLRKKVT